MPKGIEIDGCRYGQVNKAIPGVKQGAALWFRMFVSVTKEFGFTQCAVEPCFFYRFSETVICLILVHVDNLIIGCNNKLWLDNLLFQEWDKHFKVSYVTDRSLLGLTVERVSPNRFDFSMRAYIDGLVVKYGLVSKEPVHIPLRYNIEKDYDPEKMSVKNIPKDIPFASLTMELMWVGRSLRREILYAAQFFSRFMHCYTVEMFEDLKNVILYLKGTIDYKEIMIVNPDSETSISFFCDASYANSPDRKSVFGFVGFLDDCCIVARSATIKTQLTSSCEGESHGIFEAAKMCVYLYNWLSEVTNCRKPCFIFNDNTAAVLITSTPGNSGRSKHYDVKLRYVCENVLSGLIKVKFIKRGKNGADILTHSLARNEFEEGLVHLLGTRGAKQLIQKGRWYRSGGETEFTSTCTYEQVKEICSHFFG